MRFAFEICTITSFTEADVPTVTHKQHTKLDFIAAAWLLSISYADQFMRSL